MKIEKEVSKNKSRSLLIIFIFVMLFFITGFVFLKFLNFTRFKTFISLKKTEAQLLPQSLLQQSTFTQEQQILPWQQLQQPIRQGQEKQNKESVKKINKNQKKTIKILNKDERDIFKDFYKAKKKKIDSVYSTPPPLPPPPFPFNNQQNVLSISSFDYQQGVPSTSFQESVNIVIYGFYARENETFVLTNIGLLSHGSRISENETVISIARNKIITNQREIYF